MTAKLRARALTKTFGSTTVLRGIDVDLAPGECVGVHGAAGSGRTTLVRVLSTLIRPTSGTLEIDGIDTRARLQAARSRVAHVGHPAAAGPRLTVTEYLEFCRRTRGTTTTGRDGIERALQLATLRADAFVDELPAGASWALTLAAALVCRPSVALVDSAADAGVPSRLPVADAIAELRAQGAAVLVILDADAAVRSGCQRILELRDGAVMQDASPDRSPEASFAFAETT